MTLADRRINMGRGRDAVWVSTGLLAAGALVIGIVSLIVAWRLPGSSAMSRSPLAAALVLAAGWSLVATGIDQLPRGRGRGFGALLAVAGVAWLVSEWASPAIGGAIAFTIGLAAGWLYPAVVVHALFAYGGGRVTVTERAVVAAGYAIFGGLLGLVQAVTLDPSAIGCNLCPPSLIGVAPSAAIAGSAIATGSVLAVPWALGTAAVLGWDLLRASPAARRLRVPVIVPGVAFVLAVGLELGRAAGRSVLPSDEAGQWIRIIQAVLLLGMAGGVLVEKLEAGRSRDRVARVVADLRSSAPFGGLETALARTLKDPGLRIAYSVGGGREVDASGRPLESIENPTDGRVRTPIVRDGVVVAVLDHRADVLDVPATVDDVVRAARLGLEHERLQATTRSQLAEITAARKRIVAAADEERRRLERDLHDGAQQHLIAISIRMQVLAGELSEADPGSAHNVADARRELALAIEELRDVAHGIYPSILADEGLAAALEGLAEGARVPVSVEGLPVDRLDPTVEAAAYAVVAEATATGTGAVRVSGGVGDGTLVLTVSGPEVPEETLVELGDRIGAADGRLDVRPDAVAGRLILRAELPCAS